MDQPIPMSSTTEELPEVAEGDILQIDPAYRPDFFGGCLAIVLETLDWQALCLVPELQGSSVYIKIPLRHVRQTGGKIQWTLGR